MSTATQNGGRPLTVYLTAQVAGALFAIGAGWALLLADAPVWGALAPWLLVSAYLSRKRLPSEALGSALQLGAVVAIMAPLAPYVPALFDGAEVSSVTIAKELFGPALVFVLIAGLAYAVGILLKRRARRKLTKRSRKGVYHSR